MWFKQVQLFELNDKIPYTPEVISEKIQHLAFTPCLASFPLSVGWASPLDLEDAPLVYAANGYMLFCMQVEEKILPAAVIKEALMEKVKRIESVEDRKLRSKDKLSLKDEVIMDLLPKAFTKTSKTYAYIDTKKNILILGTTNPKRTEQWITLFKRSFSEGFRAFEIRKPSPIMTAWVKEKKHPGIFKVEESCILQDPNQEQRIITCRNQDLFSEPVQGFLKEGCMVKQLGLSWHDRMELSLAHDFSVKSMKYLDIVQDAARDIDADTQQERFAADFFIMTETLSAMIQDLLGLFLHSSDPVKSDSLKASLEAVE